jgi:hypothetical protein
MVKRYNVPERQARVHTHLMSVRFTSFLFGEKLDASSTLTALTSEITQLSPMGPPQYQVEVHAAEHLHNAVLGERLTSDVLLMNVLFCDLHTRTWQAAASRQRAKFLGASNTGIAWI